MSHPDRKSPCNASVRVRDGLHVHWRTRRSRARSERRKGRTRRRRKHSVCQTWHRKREGKRKKMCSYNVTAFKRLKTVISDMNSLNRPLVNRARYGDATAPLSVACRPRSGSGLPPLLPSSFSSAPSTDLISPITAAAVGPYLRCHNAWLQRMWRLAGLAPSSADAVR